MKQERGARWVLRRNEIVDRAAEVFARNGYHATGLAELCDVADLGRGALYHYIESKENLLALIHDRVLDRVLADGREILGLDVSATLQLAELGRRLVAVICDYPDHVWVFLHEYSALTGERANRFRSQRQLYESYVAQILSAGVEKGEFELDDLRTTTLAWLGMHNYTYIWIRSNPTLLPQEIAARFDRIFYRGIRKVD